MKKTFFTGSSYYVGIKRLIDVFGSVMLLVLFFPICLATMFAILFDSKGPILADVPERIGQNGKKFKMFKFRSMIVNAHFLLRNNPKFKTLFEEYKKGSYKLHNDPRVTRVGKFIRKHSFDEIPQLLNVLRGEMSLVGPRAYYPDELENQLKKFPHTKKLVSKVLLVKPGITGLWQVNGRSQIDFDERIAIDARYVDHISLWSDLKIIFKTPIVMLTGEGAV